MSTYSELVGRPGHMGPGRPTVWKELDMVRRVDPGTAEWMNDLIKNGREAFKDIGEENPLGMLDILAERPIMDKVAKTLNDEHMLVAEELESAGVIALQIRTMYPSLSLYGAIRWAEMHGYMRCREEDAIRFIRSSECARASADYVSSYAHKFGSVGIDGYNILHVYVDSDDLKTRFTKSWESDNFTINGRMRLLVRRSPLQLVEGQPESDGVYCLMIKHPITQKELEDYLWLYELELDCITNLNPKVTDLLSDPKSMINAQRSHHTHCLTCYGRGSTQPVPPSGNPPRETCDRCKGTGRVPRPQHQ